MEAPEMASSVVKSLTVMVCVCAEKALAMASTAHSKIRFIIKFYLLIVQFFERSEQGVSQGVSQGASQEKNANNLGEVR